MREYVADLGSNTSKVVDTSLSITLAKTVPAGHVVIVYLSHNDPAFGIFNASISDSKGNTYTVLDVGSSFEITFTEGRAGMMVAASRITTGLVSGDTITGSYASTGVAKVITADEFNGIVVSSFYKQTGTIDVDTLPHTALAQWRAPDPNGLIVGWVNVAGPSTDTFTDDADTAGGDGWHTTGVNTGSGGLADSNLFQHRTYKFPVSPSVDQLYNPTLGTQRAWFANLIGLWAVESSYVVRIT